MSTDEGIPTVAEIKRIMSNPVSLDPVRLVPTLSDADIAADLKRRLVEAFEPILALCNEADAKGFVLSYSSGKGPIGKHVITQLIVAKHF